MDELNEIKKRMIPYMKKTYGEHGLDMIFFMLTDIIHESLTAYLYRQWG